jgi:probable phosphoglycerate mutase
MLELYFVRHGQTEMSRANRFSGSIDPPLSPDGEQMAEAFGAAYADRTWDAIWSSPKIRALRTAEALARRVGVTPRIEDGLREIAYGEWESLHPSEAEARWPEAYAWWSADTAGRSAPGGETAFDVAARAAPVIERLRAEHPSGRVMVASHKATIRILICALLGLDVRQFRVRVGQPVAAVSRFDIGPTGPMLVRLGDVSHLPPELQRAEGT